MRPALRGRRHLPALGRWRELAADAWLRQRHQDLRRQRPSLDCRAGHWTSRTWSVKARVRLDYAAVTARCTDTELTVVSNSSAEQTTFIGGPLDDILTARVTEVLTVNGARLSEPNVRLTSDEIDAYHDLHPSPAKAWIDPFGHRVVLHDDDYGVGFLDIQGTPMSLLTCDFLLAGWQQAQSTGVYTV